MGSQTSHVAKLSIFLAQMKFLFPSQEVYELSERRTLKPFQSRVAVVSSRILI